MSSGEYKVDFCVLKTIARTAFYLAWWFPAMLLFQMADILPHTMQSDTKHCNYNELPLFLAIFLKTRSLELACIALCPFPNTMCVYPLHGCLSIPCACIHFICVYPLSTSCVCIHCMLVVADTQSDSIQCLIFAKKWLIQYCFAQDSIQNILN